MKIVKLAGGLGNQMFIYAFGLALSKKYKRVYFDIKNYKSDKLRQYELGLFPNIKIKIRNRPKLIPFHKTNEKNPFSFNPDFFNAHLNEYWSGYFQNEKYFKNIESDIRDAFQFPKTNDEFNTDWANEIQNSENSVFIHIRRGDYENLDGWLLGMDYYKRAVKYILSHIKNPTFFVFSDAPADYIKNKFDIGCEYKYIGTHNNDTNQSFRDMQLMSLCRHAIIANSSFSWWGAYLQRNKNHIVCAPSPWLNNQDEIICDDWIKIPHK
ncbi:MAG: alpha-1,2-fucosyltransferase [Alphaproteobacteria bacterium]|nr:alpha-1,2-fucosyltransferase [Alphaproteobacteria bacterium]